MKKLYSILFLSLLLPLQALFAANSYGLPDNIQQGNILHCFNWKYNDIKAELPNIAEAGFVAVQTSPAQNAGGGAWYMLYQPYEFAIDSNPLGTKAELQALCQEADKYGVKVIVDVVANHLNGSMDWVWDQELKNDNNCWHSHGSNINYSNRWQVTHGDIGMRDLANENPKVYNKVKAYVDVLKSLGVDGIRWDAAKHIQLPSEGSDFWSVVTSAGLYNYGEILEGPIDNKSDESKRLMKEYTDYISVTDNAYGNNIRNSYINGNTYGAYADWGDNGVSRDKLVLWAESHDTYCNKGESQWANQDVIDQVYAIVASRENEAALYFSRPFKTGHHEIQSGEKGSTNFTTPKVAEVNKFRNAMIGTKDYFVNENGVNAVLRGYGAVVVKPKGSGNVTISNANGTVAPGTYIDQVGGGTWTVTASQISGNIGSTGIAVFYDAKQSASVSFNPAGGNFRSETLKVTATATNASSAWYKIGDGKVVNINGSAQFTIGADMEYGESVTVSWGANGESGEVSGSETYTKVDPSASTMIYYNNPNNWNQVYAYIYADGGNNKNAEWPGEAMSKGTASYNGVSGLWEYEVPAGLENGMVIFNNNQGQQYPSSDGLQLSGNSMVCINNSEWSEFEESVSPEPEEPEDVYTPSYEEGETVVFFENTRDWSGVKIWLWNGVYTEIGSFPGDEIEYMGEAANGNGIYKWTYTGDNKDLPVGLLFSNSENQNDKTGDFQFQNGGYYTADGFQRLIEPSVPSAVDEAEKAQAVITSEAGMITVWNAEGSDITVYDLCGVPVEQVYNAGSQLAISIAYKGVYVVTVDDEAVKVMVR